MKLKPTIRPSDASRAPGYLAKRFKEIAKQQLAEQLRQEANERERSEKVLRMNAVARRAG